MDAPSADVIRAIVAEECTKAIQVHLAQCPFTVTGVEPRMRKLETRFATMVGLIAGSGTFGGTMGALLAKLLV